MLSIEAFSGIIGVAIFVAISIIVGSMEIINNKRYSKYQLLAVILYVLSALSITAIAIVYLVGVESYINDVTTDRDMILASNTNCSVTKVEGAFNAYDNKYYYLIWFSYNNITQFYYKDTCDNIVKCVPAVNDTVKCWPINDGRTIIAYAINPTVPDIDYYQKHRVWAIVQLVGSVIITILLMIAICNTVISMVNECIVENESKNIQQIPANRSEHMEVESEGESPVYK